jgi:hypothetical protein
MTVEENTAYFERRTLKITIPLLIFNVNTNRNYFQLRVSLGKLEGWAEKVGK